MYNYQARANPFAYRRPMAKKIPVKVTPVTAEQVWAFAATADRINGGEYLKESRRSTDGLCIIQEANRSMINRWLTEGYCGEDTEADWEQGRAARAWHKGRLLMTALKRPLSGFEENLSKAADMDEFALEIHRLEIATIASQIRSYRTGMAAEQRLWATDTTPLAAIGARVECEVEVVKAVYSTNYGIYFATAVTTADRKVVRFSYRSQLDVGQVISIKGRVKAHGADGTQLNYVKAI